MNSKSSQKQRKERYEPPRLRIIEIEADQVLGVGCKLESGGVAFGATPCPVNFCAESGS